MNQGNRCCGAWPVFLFHDVAYLSKGRCRRQHWNMRKYGIANRNRIAEDCSDTVMYSVD